MDITPFLEDIQIAPRAVFNQLATRRDQPRFMVPTAPGKAEWRPVTWGAFADEIRDLACFLATILEKGDRAAVFAPNSVAWASASLAIQAADGVMVPIYPASTTDQYVYVASHSDARVVFVDNPVLLGRVLEGWSRLPLVEKIVLLDSTLDVAKVRAGLEGKVTDLPSSDELGQKLLSLAEARKIGAAADAEDPAAFEKRMLGVSLEQPGTMLYTSGTSGNPKGVPLTHNNVGANGADWMRCNGPLIEENMTDILWLPMSHIFGFGEMCLGNILGWTTYLSDPVSCLGQLGTIQPDIFFSVPSHWEKLAVMSMHEPTPEAKLAKFEATTGGKLKFCLSGGAGLKREVKEFFHACGVLVVEGYGLTETSPTLTLNRPDAFRFDSVGKVLPSVEVRLAEDGEIEARGPNVFAGYHKDPVATKEAFTEDGWFKTGDVGRFTDDGFLQIIDRKKDILVTAGGKNVPPTNIELRFKDDPLIAHVVVYGEAKKFLVAGIWLNDEAAKAAGDALPGLIQKRVDEVNAGLANYETIKKFAIVSEPLTVENEMLTASLKLRRKKVYDRFKPTFEGLYEDTRTVKPADAQA